MHSIAASALALALWPLAVSAGQYRDLIDARNARYERFAQPEPARRSLEERSATYQFMTNSTKREFQAKWAIYGHDS